MIVFDNINAFYVLILLVIVYLISASVKNYESYFSAKMLKKIIVGKNTKHKNMLFLILSFIFLVISLARPVIENKPIKVSTSAISIVCVFDVSKSMSANDIYPNRLEFAKKKFSKLLKILNNEKVGVIGFTSRAFLISPTTNDYATLNYLVKHISQSSVMVQGSDILVALQSVNDLLKDQSTKAMLVFTDGTDTNDFENEIEYAKENNIKVFVYATATKQGSTIALKDDILKDNNGNIVVSALNSSIKELAIQSGGSYLEFSTSSDMDMLVDDIRYKFKSPNKKEDDQIINTNEELFYIPLVLAFVFFMIGISTFRKDQKW
jgi:Ca-activated chloride channel family protein